MPMVTKPTGSKCNAIIGVLRARTEEPLQASLKVCTVLACRLSGLLKSKPLLFPTHLNLLHTKIGLSVVNSDKCPTMWGSCSLIVHCIFSLLFVPALTFMFYGAESRPESISKTSETYKTVNKDKVRSFPAACDTGKLLFLQHNCYLVLLVF